MAMTIAKQPMRPMISPIPSPARLLCIEMARYSISHIPMNSKWTLDPGRPVWVDLTELPPLAAAALPLLLWRIKTNTAPC